MESPVEHAPLNDSAGEAVTVVRFTGARVSFDTDTISRVADSLFNLADEPGGADLLLDFANVEYVSSTALGFLIRLHKKLEADGRRLAIANLDPQVREVFAVTKLDTYLDLRGAGGQAVPAADCSRFGAPCGVLVVDDDPVIRYVLTARLRHEGFLVWSACHGHQAVELYRRNGSRIAAVLLDVLMPGLDGPATLNALQRVCPAVRCCFMTGNPAPYTEEALLRMGAVRVFGKPFAFTEVLDTLRRLGCRPPRCVQDRWMEIPLNQGV